MKIPMTMFVTHVDLDSTDIMVLHRRRMERFGIFPGDKILLSAVPPVAKEVLLTIGWLGIREKEINGGDQALIGQGVRDRIAELFSPAGEVWLRPLTRAPEGMDVRLLIEKPGDSPDGQVEKEIVGRIARWAEGEVAVNSRLPYRLPSGERIVFIGDRCWGFPVHVRDMQQRDLLYVKDLGNWRTLYDELYGSPNGLEIKLRKEKRKLDDARRRYRGICSEFSSGKVRAREQKDLLKGLFEIARIYGRQVYVEGKKVALKEIPKDFLAALQTHKETLLELQRIEKGSAKPDEEGAYVEHLYSRKTWKGQECITRCSEMIREIQSFYRLPDPLELVAFSPGEGRLDDTDIQALENELKGWKKKDLPAETQQTEAILPSHVLEEQVSRYETELAGTKKEIGQIERMATEADNEMVKLADLKERIEKQRLIWAAKAAENNEAFRVWINDLNALQANDFDAPWKGWIELLQKEIMGLKTAQEALESGKGMPEAMNKKARRHGDMLVAVLKGFRRAMDQASEYMEGFKITHEKPAKKTHPKY